MAFVPARPPLITVIGATGTGKSNLAVDLALALNGEIINGDAMQMYKGLPIITNKITKEEMCGVPHHLLSFLDVKEVWQVGKFVREAERIIEKIRSRGRLPILVGGTHYYLQSLLFPHSIPPLNKTDESPADKEDEEEGHPDKSYPFPSVSGEMLEDKYPILNADTPVLYEILRQVDPTIAAKWHPNDRRKIYRSLQIYYASNCTRTASEVYAAQRVQKQNSTWTRYKNLIFWVHAETNTLKNRLDGRVDKMITSGMWQEIEEMKLVYDSAVVCNAAAEEGGVDLNSGIWQSIGFKEFLPFLEMRDNVSQEGEEKEKELEDVRKAGLESMKTATRQYARSQVKWIRIKFLNALKTGGNETTERDDTQQTKKTRNENGDIFLLDSTDVTSFSETVRTAVNIAKDFLSGITSLPDPLSLSPLARTSLLPKRAYDLADRPDLWIQRTCKLCGVTCTNADQWQIHKKSQRHQKTVSREKRRPEVETFIRMRKEKEEREEEERRRVVEELVGTLEGLCMEGGIEPSASIGPHVSG